MEKTKVLVGLSGGVDSAVCAHLLLKEGFAVEGGTLYMHDNPESGAENETRDAAKVAAFLGIGHHVVDLRGAFCASVMRYFADSYLEGLTPNPCVFCNRNMKFPGMLDYAEKIGCEAIATGHYARVKRDGDRTLLLRSADRKKDQTYMLYALTDAQLSKVMFPLGGLTKEEIREIAASIHLPVAAKQDSQDICFIKDGDYAGFIERFTGKVPAVGNFVATDGKVIAPHKGMIYYTVGQRKGLGIASTEPYYVVEKDAVENTVTLGRAGDLFSTRVHVTNTNFIAMDAPQSDFYAAAKLRYSQTESRCRVIPTEDGMFLEFDEPQRAVTPGQSAVLYDGDVVIGGGVITNKKE